jgi:uncharacterized membrane protein YeaQ/YmgE (transglycosylase-associated protein family)
MLRDIAGPSTFDYAQAICNVSHGRAYPVRNRTSDTAEEAAWHADAHRSASLAAHKPSILSVAGVRFADTLTESPQKRRIEGEIAVDPTSLITFLAIGAVAGWLAGLIMKGAGFGLIGNIVVGIIGAFVGGFLANVLGLSASGLLGSILLATLGAVVLLFLIGLIKRA